MGQTLWTRTDEFGRYPPQVENGYSSVLYAIVDPFGNEVSDFYSDYDDIVDLRNNTESWERYRIIEVEYKLVGLNPDPAMVIDDPVRQESVCPKCGLKVGKHTEENTCGLVVQ